MTDCDEMFLRDRIVAAILTENDIVYQADAVIRELGNLRLEPHKFQCGRDDCARTRVISDWSSND